MLHSIINFYLLYGAYLDGFFIWIRIVVAVLVGIICANNFNKTNEKDLVGYKKLLATIFISSLIFFFTPSFVTLKYMLGTGMVMGYGADNLMVKWRKNKIWNKYDILNTKKDDDNGKE